MRGNFPPTIICYIFVVMNSFTLHFCFSSYFLVWCQSATHFLTHAFVCLFLPIITYIVFLSVEMDEPILFVGQTFCSYEEFLKTKLKYEKEKNMVWVTSNSISIKSENLKLAARGDSERYKPELVHKNIRFTCKFGGDQRIRSGKSVRPHQSYVFKCENEQFSLRNF